MLEYDAEFLEEVDSAVDLAEYIGQTIELKRRGKKLFGSCPLHVDKTPSLCVDEEKNSFRCYSCGASGKIISFMKTYEKLGFHESVKKAADLANMDLTKLCQSNTVKLNRTMRKISKTAKDVSHPILDPFEIDKYAKIPIEPWLNEGIGQEEIDLFDVRIDARSNRIVYPVYDLYNNLINIKGRTLYADFKKMSVPKYINYFPVGIMDYFQGLNITLPYVIEKKEIIIFESIKSTMKLMSYGIDNSASAEKHTLTMEQIKLLIELGVDIVLAYDSDVSYSEPEVEKNINTLKRFCNLWVIEDKEGLLGKPTDKNSPIDCGFPTWEKLYNSRRKIL